MVDYDGLTARKAEARKRGKYLGVGMSIPTSEVCGVAPSKWIGLPRAKSWGAGLTSSANIRVHLTGKVVVTSGSQSHGQGHETTDGPDRPRARLGSRSRTIIVEHSDTQGTPFGYGSYGSRSAVGRQAWLPRTRRPTKIRSRP